jgi:hypothetical protein
VCWGMRWWSVHCLEKIKKIQRKRKGAKDETSGGELDSHNRFLIWSVTWIAKIKQYYPVESLY